MRTAFIIMSAPTVISAGPTAYGGMLAVRQLPGWCHACATVSRGEKGHGHHQHGATAFGGLLPVMPNANPFCSCLPRTGEVLPTCLWSFLMRLGVTKIGPYMCQMGTQGPSCCEFPAARMCVGVEACSAPIRASTSPSRKIR